MGAMGFMGLIGSIGLIGLIGLIAGSFGTLGIPDGFFRKCHVIFYLAFFMPCQGPFLAP